MYPTLSQYREFLEYFAYKLAIQIGPILTMTTNLIGIRLQIQNVTTYLHDGAENRWDANQSSVLPWSRVDLWVLRPFVHRSLCEQHCLWALCLAD